MCLRLWSLYDVVTSRVFAMRLQKHQIKNAGLGVVASTPTHISFMPKISINNPQGRSPVWLAPASLTTCYVTARATLHKTCDTDVLNPKP